jgi:hypothetical protein
MTNLRPIAFVLPQFHPIPENDEWWGKGFTEWTNVVKATPQFKGHYQPHLPTDLGFYDLRLPEARKAQADLAKEYGIYGFCYYHYWFNGKRLLDQPIDEMLRLKEPDMPFMLCWANENWTRRWDGKDEEILIRQDYNFEDDKEHIRWLCEKVFCDERYIRVDNCPVFVVYRPDLFPDIQKTVKLWREIAIKEYGFKDIYLCFTESFQNKINPEKINFDAAIEFAPHEVLKTHIQKSKNQKIKEKLYLSKRKKISFRDFKEGVKNSINRAVPEYKFYRCVTPSWDNTARRNENATICLGSNPELYYGWLKNTILHFKPFSQDENFIFINAMNEWAEGNHLEPCIKYGRQYLEATKKAFKDVD